MRKVLIIVAGALLGIVLANLIIFGWELALQHLPFGRTIDPAELAQPGVVAAIPLAAKLWVVFGYALGSLCGALLAWRIARWDFVGWIVAAFVAAAGIANAMMIPQPLWMNLCAVANPFIGAVLAFGLHRRWRAADLHLRR